MEDAELCPAGGHNRHIIIFNATTEVIDSTCITNGNRQACRRSSQKKNLRPTEVLNDPNTIFVKKKPARSRNTKQPKTLQNMANLRVCFV